MSNGESWRVLVLLLAGTACAPGPSPSAVPVAAVAHVSEDTGLAATAPAEADASAAVADGGAAPNEASVDAAPKRRPTAPCAAPPGKAPGATCGAVEVTGAPPCEWECRVDGHKPWTKSRKRYDVFYAAGGKVPREILRIEIYDGPAVIDSPDVLLMNSVHVYTDESTTPPTLETRKGSCYFPASLAEHKRFPDDEDASDAAARAACPVTAKYRYDGTKLAPLAP